MLRNAIGNRVDAAEQPSPLASTHIAILLIIAVAVATRIGAWWNPVADIDDPFYLFVGEQLLKGHWPYVDVWDRKPLGLFLLHAGIAFVGGGSIFALNLIATAFAAATAFVVRQISQRFASPSAALFAALTYLIFLPLLYGQTGQTPIFYNLLMAGAAAMLFRATDCTTTGPLRRLAFGAMFLCGLSVWIKQVAFVEGAYFGLAFLWLLHRRGESLPAIFMTGLGMILVAMLPNLLSIVGYAIAGRSALGIYLHANFISIFERTSWGWHSRGAGLALFALFLFPLIAMAIAGLRTTRMKQAGTVARALLAGWLVAALLGFIIVPEFFPHYALPLLLPLCVAAAAFFSRTSGGLFFGALVAFCAVLGPMLDWRPNQLAAAEYSRLNHAVQSARRGGCIYLADGPTRLYSTTKACTLTRYLFPDHLSIVTESGAVGTNTVAEVTRVLEQRPAVIVTQNRNRLRYNPLVNQLLEQSLRAGYRLVYRSPEEGPKLVKGTQVWQRKDLPAPTN